MIFPQNRSLTYYVESGYRPANRHTFLSWTGLRLRSNKFKFIYVVDRCCIPSLVVQTCSRDPLHSNTTQEHQCKHQHLHHTPLLLQIRTPPLGTTVTLATRWLGPSAELDGRVGADDFVALLRERTPLHGRDHFGSVCFLGSRG